MTDVEITRLKQEIEELKKEKSKSNKFNPYPTKPNVYIKPKRIYRPPTDFEKPKIKKILSDINNIDDIIKLKYIPNINSLRWCSVYIDKLVKLSNSLQELDNIVGMKDIKESLFNNIFPLLVGTKGIDDFYHTVISGPPGTGKSILGKLLCKLYYNLDIISEDKFVLASRDTMIGEYLGQTAIKTQKIIDKALGGVLFIDEAYSLGNDSGKDIYSKECLDTINKNLSENRDKFICIIAGYKDALDKNFFKTNEGLKRRFGFWYNIDGYNPEELYQIFILKLNKVIGLNYKTHELNKEKLKELFKDASKFPYYGGSIEQLVQIIKMIYSKNKVLNDKQYLDYDDINTAYNLYINNQGLEHNKNSYSLMYM